MKSDDHPDTLTQVFYTPSPEAKDNLKVAWLTPHLNTEFLWRPELCTGYLAHMLTEKKKKEKERGRKEKKDKKRKGVIRCRGFGFTHRGIM